MTTIAWDGQTIAADCRRSWGTSYKDGDVKLMQRGDTIFAGLGCVALFMPMVGWYLAGADSATVPTVKDEDCALLVFKDGKCGMYKSTVPYLEEFTSPETWGSGGQYAMGAMCHGATAEEAIKIAAQCDMATSALYITTFKFVGAYSLS